MPTAGEYEGKMFEAVLGERLTIKEAASNPQHMVDTLTMYSDAYNILYRLGYEPATVPQMTYQIAAFWLRIARQTWTDMESGLTPATQLHQLLRDKVPAHQLESIAKRY